MTRTSPMQRTLAVLRKQGWTCAIVERFNQYARVRQDLFNGIDIVAIRPAGPNGGGIFGVQCTTASNRAAHVAKLLAEPKLRTWVEAGARLQVWAWSKRGARGKRKLWDYDVTELTRVDFASEVAA